MTLSVRDDNDVRSAFSHFFQNLLSWLVLLRAPSWRHSVSDGVLPLAPALLRILWIPFGKSCAVISYGSLLSNSRRMMMTSGSGVNYKSMFDAGSQIIAKEGTKSLFKGAGANILRGVAGAGVLSLYDKLQQVMFGKVYSGGTRFLETTTSKRLKCLQDLVKLSMLSHTIDLFRLLPSFWCGYSIPRRFVAVDKCIMAAMDSFNSKPCGRVA